jgi:hypothetical protein
LRSRTVGELRDSARALLGELGLEQIHILRCELETFDREQEGPFSTDTGFQVTGIRQGDAIEARALYVTEAVKKLDDGDTVPIWTIEVECAAVFEGTDGADLDAFTDDQIEAFAVLVGAPALHPYVRELTQSLSSRTMYPAFTLGLMASFAEMPPDFEIEFPDRSDVADLDSSSD